MWMLPLTTGPYHLLGPCWGAAVVFEMCARLTAFGRTPTSLSLIDSAVLLRADRPGPRVLGRGLIRDRLEMYWEEFRDGDWRSRARLLASKTLVAARLARSGGQSVEGQLDLYQRRVMEANRQAIETYLPKPLSAPTRIFLTDRAELEGAEDPRLEWVKLVNPAPPVVRISGFDSGDALQSHAAALAVALNEWLVTAESAV